MKLLLGSLFAVPVLLGLVSCDQPAAPPASEALQTAREDQSETQLALNEARDALERQALEIETKTALMEKKLTEMGQALKDRENDELRASLEDLKKQNDELRAQSDAARRQSSVITQRIAATAPPETLTPQTSAPRDLSLFYDNLSLYGTWIDVSGYGDCWSPTVHSQSWRPYVDGCWVWSSLGWTWQSNEPFGWAVYHYGRWVNLARHGWVWVPGCEWAPAWVAWRQSDHYVGWAPLPPDREPCHGVYRDCDSRYDLGPASYTFITTNHFVRPSYTTVCAPVTHNITIFQSSVNITQIVRREGRHHGNVFVHHGGPARAQMEQACGTPVPEEKGQAFDPGADPRLTEHQQVSRDSVTPLAMAELPAARADAPPSRPEIAQHIETVVTAPAAVTPSGTTLADNDFSASTSLPIVPVAVPAVEVMVPDPPLTAAVAATDPQKPAKAPVGADPAATPPVQTETVPPPADIVVSQQPNSETMNPAQEAVATEGESARLQAVTRRQEEAAARRVEEERILLAQQEAERRAQEMEQRQAEDAARRAAEEEARRIAEAEMRRAEEIARHQAEEAARRAQEEAARRAQEEAQRAAEDASRRAQEEAARRAQEEAQRAAEEASRRAQEEAARRAQEEAQRAAEDAARRAQEAAQRAAEEASRRAAEEAARNQ